jgi:CRISPR-associated protein Cmr1
MPGVMKIKITTLSPIWTGGAAGICDRLHETGIIGSLRWWYEAIVRGLGGYACDPTDNCGCELSGKEETDDEREEKLCPVCYLFGCGGWRRRYRLEIVNDGETVPFQLATLDTKGAFNHWWLSQIFEDAIDTDLFFGNVTLSFKPIGSNHELIKKQLTALLSIMSHIGAIGAKTQYGFGLFEFKEMMELNDALLVIQEFLNNHTFKYGKNETDWYSLKEFWLYELTISSQNKLVGEFKNATIIGKGERSEQYLPVSFDIRYKLPKSANATGLRQAYYLGHNRDKQKTRKNFGTLINEKIGSRVFVSHLYKKNEADDNYWLRVWGFTEESAGNDVGEELKKMFAFEETPYMNCGKEIVGCVRGDQ